MDLRYSLAAVLMALAPVAPATAQDQFGDAEITTTVIKPGVAVLFGPGGNIGVSHGPDGTILIDDQFASLTPKIQKAVAALDAAPTRFLINTHWHFDHAGANAEFGRAGALIVAHRNVRIRLIDGGKVAGIDTPPARPEALPVVTYDNGLSLHVNGDTLDVLFLGGGHTDGDSVIFWRKANVVHTGDLFIKDQGYPFVDLGSGGNVEHLLMSLARVIAMIDENTIVIPGHGKVANRTDLIAYRQMVQTAVDRVRALKDAGQDLAAITAARPLEGLRNAKGYLSDDDFVAAIWDSLEAHAP